MPLALPHACASQLLHPSSFYENYDKILDWTAATQQRDGQRACDVKVAKLTKRSIVEMRRAFSYTFTKIKANEGTVKVIQKPLHVSLDGNVQSAILHQVEDMMRLPDLSRAIAMQIFSPTSTYLFDAASNLLVHGIHAAKCELVGSGASLPENVQQAKDALFHQDVVSFSVTLCHLDRFQREHFTCFELRRAERPHVSACRTQAAAVVQMLHLLITGPGGLLDLDAVKDLGLMALYVAATVHGFQHTGFSDEFLIQTQHPLALR
ncbi:hypothetical protein WJX74_008128 [Apatococcus lobatus]|uniref:PDEase domain-containing protein n=1 Tax=Apatococcus lobatus TaxID=904363 RepID=A0AAW1R1C6_9CHLO